MEQQQRVDTGFLLRVGTAGSIFVAAVGTPIDVARRSAQLAIAPKKPTLGLRASLRHVAAPGFAGLWRGLPWAVSRASLAPGVFIVTYEKFRSNYYGAVHAAVIARSVQVVALQPLEFMKSIRQSGMLLDVGKKTHMQQSLWSHVISDGLRSFWRGVLPTLARDVPACYCFWTAYIDIGRRLERSGLEDWEESAPASPMLSAALGAGLAVGTSLATQPLDVIKTHMQAHEMVKSDRKGYRHVTYARVGQTFRDVRHLGGGASALWTGGAARALRMGGAGLLLGPLYEFTRLVADDDARPVRQVFYLPDEDEARKIIHPRNYVANWDSTGGKGQKGEIL